MRSVEALNPVGAPPGGAEDCRATPARSAPLGGARPINLIHEPKAPTHSAATWRKTAKNDDILDLLEYGDSSPSDCNQPRTCQRGISNLPSQIGRYSTARNRAQEAVAFLAARDEPVLNSESGKRFQPLKLSLELSRCANYLAFRHYPTVDQVRLTHAYFCHRHLLCPVCAIRRGSRMMQKYISKYEDICAQNPSLVPALLTLTVKSGANLSERQAHLMSAVREFFKRGRRAKSGSRHRSEAVKIEAAFGSYEVTHTPKGWHPHVHIVVLLNQFIDRVALSREWLALTGDSKIVDIRRIDATNNASAFAEVCKYALKFGTLSLEKNLDAFLSLFGKRLVFSLGLFRGWEPPEDLLDEKIEDLPYIEYLYRYFRGEGYRLESVTPSVCR